MIYRATPLENGYSPSELLMGRMLQTTLPSYPGNLQVKSVSRGDIQDKETSINLRTKHNFDSRHRAHQLADLTHGSRVFIRDMAREGVIAEAPGQRSFIVQTDQGKVRRNRNALVQIPQDQQDSLGIPIGAEGTGQCQTNPASHLVSQAAPDTLSAEGTGQCQTIPASQMSDARQLVGRPIRAKRRPKKYQDYETDF